MLREAGRVGDVELECLQLLHAGQQAEIRNWVAAGLLPLARARQVEVERQAAAWVVQVEGGDGEMSGDSVSIIDFQLKLTTVKYALLRLAINVFVWHLRLGVRDVSLVMRSTSLVPQWKMVSSPSPCCWHPLPCSSSSFKSSRYSWSRWGSVTRRESSGSWVSPQPAT